MSRLVLALLTTFWALSGAQAGKFLISEDTCNGALKHPNCWQQLHTGENFQEEKNSIMQGFQIGIGKLALLANCHAQAFSQTHIQESVYAHQEALFYAMQATVFFDKLTAAWDQEEEESAFQSLNDCLHKTKSALQNGVDWASGKVAYEPEDNDIESEPLMTQQDLVHYLTHFGSTFSQIRQAMIALQESPEFANARPPVGQAISLEAIESAF